MISLGVICGLLAAFFYAGTNVLDAKLSHASFKHAYSLIVYASVLNGLFIPFLWAYHPPRLPHPAEWGVLTGVATLEIVALWAYFKAFKAEETSVISCLLVFATILVPLLSGLLGYEALPPQQWLGFGLCLAAALWLTYQPQATSTSKQAALWALLAGAAYATINVGDDWLVNSLHWTSVYAFGQLLMVGFAVLPFLYRPWRQAVVSDWPVFKDNFGVFLATETVYLAGTVAALWAFKAAPVGIVAGLIATKPFFTLAILQILPKSDAGNWVGDAPNTAQSVAKKLICFALVVLGVVLFSV
jgi:uncharacterized membrane protein